MQRLQVKRKNVLGAVTIRLSTTTPMPWLTLSVPILIWIGQRNKERKLVSEMNSYDYPEINLSEIFKEILDMSEEEFHEMLSECAETHLLGDLHNRLSFYDYTASQTAKWRDIASYERRHALLDLTLETSNAAESGRYIGISKQRAHDMTGQAKHERLRKIGAFEAIGE